MPTGSMPAGTDPQGQPPDNPPPLRLRKRRQEPEGSLAAELRQGRGPLRDRRSAIGAYTRAVRRDRRLDADQDAGRPDLGVLCGRKPVRTAIAGLLLTVHPRPTQEVAVNLT
jgi:hypothetical protein